MSGHSRFLKVRLIPFLMLFSCLGYAQTPAEKPIAVYVVALRGECGLNRPVAVINGQAVVVPGAPLVGNAPKEKTVLTRFVEDKSVLGEVEQELRRFKAVQLVEQAVGANFVLCFCNQYFEQMRNMSRQGPTEPVRVFTQAVAVPVGEYLKSPNDPRPLTQTAFWKSDTLMQGVSEAKPDLGKQKDKKQSLLHGNASVNGVALDHLPPPVLPANLVRRFMKQLPQLTATIAALPKPATNELVKAARPVLQADPLAPKTEPQTSAETLPSEAVLRIETTLVLLPVMALDKDGKYLPGLKAENFSVFEDGVKQEISDFGSTETPIHVALVLDVSGSTRFKIEDIQEAALAFIEQLRPQDQVLVVSFDTTVRVESEFTNDRGKLMRAILRTKSGSATRLQDALDLILTERLQQLNGRKAMVVFTDGVDTMSWLAQWQDVLTRAEEAGVLAYPVRYDTLNDLPLQNAPGVRGVGSGNTQEEYERGQRQLKTLAAKTGGRYYEVTNLGDTKQAFGYIAEELRRYYWLGYYPANETRDSRYRRIRVTTNQPGTVIRTREGYRPLPEKKGNTETPRPQLLQTKPDKQD